MSTKKIFTTSEEEKTTGSDKNKQQTGVDVKKSEGQEDLSKKQSTSSRSLFEHGEKQLILFAYNRLKDEQPPEQIMILQQTRKKLKRGTEEQKLTQMLNQINIDNSTEKWFLSKINPEQRKELSTEIKNMLSVAHRHSQEERYERRQQIFAASKARRQMDVATEEVIASRTIRVVKLSSLQEGGAVRGVVELGGKNLEYEDLLGSDTKDYYTLVKKKVNAEQVFPQITLEEHLYGHVQFDSSQQQNQKNEDDFDSNASDNPNYDYPDQDDSSSSQGLIGEKSWGSDEEMDEEELYRGYLRRVKKREAEMDVEDNYIDYDYQ